MTPKEIAKINELYKQLDEKNVRVEMLEKNVQVLEASLNKVIDTVGAKIEDLSNRIDKLNKK